VDTTHLINGITFPAWKIRAHIELTDQNNKPITLQDGDLKSLTVTFRPERDQNLGKVFEMRIPLARPDEWPWIQVGLPGFSSEPFNLDTAVKDKNVKISYSQRSIELSTPIVLTQNRSSDVYNPLAAELRPVDPTSLSSTRLTENRIGGEQ
jgi:hypothetical protein